MLDIGKFWSSSSGRSTIPRAIRLGARSSADGPIAADITPTDTRGADRFVPHHTSTVLTFESGKRLKARIVNLSPVGVAVEADLSNVDPETVMLVGAHPVTFGRKIALGGVFLFVKPISERRCNASIRL